MGFKFINDLLATAEIPNEGIQSRILQKDEHVNIALFGCEAWLLRIHAAAAPTCDRRKNSNGYAAHPDEDAAEVAI